MKHKKIIIGVIVMSIALLIVIGSIVFLRTEKNISAPQVISGQVTNISNECNVDGTCSVILDSSKVIVTGCGLGPGDETCKPYDQSKLHVGQQIDATVMEDGLGRFSLACDSCTIRVVGE